MEKPTREQLAFMRDLARHTAQLMDFSKPYIGRLSGTDRDYFLSKALEAAWTRREEFVPTKENEGLLRWWNVCLKDAAKARTEWRCSTFDAKFVMVPGSKLGQELL